MSATSEGGIFCKCEKRRQSGGGKCRGPQVCATETTAGRVRERDGVLVAADEHDVVLVLASEERQAAKAERQAAKAESEKSKAELEEARAQTRQEIRRALSELLQTPPGSGSHAGFSTYG